MKAITVWQPWASAIAAGVKGYETRAWATAYRGPVIVHAARTRRGLKALNRPPFAFLQSDLPFGAAIAVANLVDVIPTGQRPGRTGVVAQNAKPADRVLRRYARNGEARS